MRPQDVITPPAPDPIDVEQAEAALVEHYPRLVRLAYLVLPPRLGRNRRVLTAHSLVQRSLPRSRTAGVSGLPLPRREGARPDPGYAYVRQQVLRQALEAGLPLRRRAWPKRAQLPPLLPQVWGLRLFPRSGGADELALDQRLSALSGPGRAAYALRGLERMRDAEVAQTLAAAGAADPDAAQAEADGVAAGAGAADGARAEELLRSAEFDPCSLQARPTDLMRRRQHTKAALAATAAVVVCGTLLGLPGEGSGPRRCGRALVRPQPGCRAGPRPGEDGPGRTRRVEAVLPYRLLRLAGPRRPHRRQRPAAPRPRRLGQAGPVRADLRDARHAGGPADGVAAAALRGRRRRGARVVLLYDGLRVDRYAEPQSGAAGAALDFARVDGADAAGANALVVGRTDGNVRYLTAPWVRKASVRDLLDPAGAPAPLDRTRDGVTDPLTSPAQAGRLPFLGRPRTARRRGPPADDRPR